MARIRRVVIPNTPHHITQRGVRSITITKNYYLFNVNYMN